jgi:AraC-like DNA-binding protein
VPQGHLRPELLRATGYQRDLSGRIDLVRQFPFAQRLHGRLADIAADAMFQKAGAWTELRCRLMTGAIPQELGVVVETMIAEPMLRLSQLELADRLKMERTSALRMFKGVTGMTFRRFNQWSALRHAARQMAAGEQVRTAAVNTGFADSAHLTRTFRASFGLTRRKLSLEAPRLARKLKLVLINQVPHVTIPAICSLLIDPHARQGCIRLGTTRNRRECLALSGRNEAGSSEVGRGDTGRSSRCRSATAQWRMV